MARRLPFGLRLPGRQPQDRDDAQEAAPEPEAQTEAQTEAQPSSAPRSPSGRIREISRPTAAPSPFVAPSDPEPDPLDLPDDELELDELAAPQAPPPVVPIAARFSTAAAALAFAGQLDGPATYGRTREPDAWWVRVSAPLAVSREQVAALRGRTFVEVDGAPVPDRGWGDLPPDPALRVADTAAPAEVGLYTLVRTAGMRRADLPVPEELVVLVPRQEIQRWVARALDLRLTVRWRATTVEPLFAEGVAPDAGIRFELRIGAPTGGLPPSLITALDQAPDTLVCRPVGERLLVQHPLASPLPDPLLAQLAEADRADGRWLLAAPEYGCARLRRAGRFADAAALVTLDDLPMVDLEPGPADDTPDDERPPTARLAVVSSHARGVDVAAVLLDDDELRVLPALLEGRPLAEAALLVRGRDKHLLLPPDTGDRHLLLAPGGLLERLPVGEALECIGPGLLYVPLGQCLQPALPPAGRATLFPPDPGRARVLWYGAVLVFTLDSPRPEPVWTLWAGPLPPVDEQVPRDVTAVLAEVERSVTPPPAPPRRIRQVDAQQRPVVRDPARTWWDDAFDLERAGELAAAARLHEQHGQLLRAAHLYERAFGQGER